MFTPNGKRLYGSASTLIPTTGFLVESGCGKYSQKKFYQVLFITKTHIKALSQPTQLCYQESTDTTASTCIARFIENQLDCSAMMLGGEYLGKPGKPLCTTNLELRRLANISRLLEQADGNDIYEMTGCLSPCEKDSFTISAEPLRTESVLVPFVWSDNLWTDIGQEIQSLSNVCQDSVI